MKTAHNLFVKSGYALGLGFSLVLLFILITTENKSWTFVFLFTPLVLFLLYLRFVLAGYYDMLIDKRLRRYRKYNLQMDKMLTPQVQKGTFYYLW